MPRLGRPKGYKPAKIRKHGVSQQVEKDIFDAIATGVSLDELHKSNPDKYPPPIAVYTKMENNTVFRNKIHAARKILSNVLVEKLHSLRANPPLKDIGMTDKEYSIIYNIWCKQLKSVHDELHQLGSIFNSQFIKLQKVDTTETHIQQVVIQDYKDYKEVSDNITKQLKSDLIPDKSIKSNDEPDNDINQLKLGSNQIDLSPLSNVIKPDVDDEDLVSH